MNKIQPTIKNKRVKHDYIDNKEFYNAMKDFIEITNDARDQGVPDHELPEPSKYIGDSIFMIATHMQYSRNFIGYTYREEMVLDGIEDAWKAIRNFDPDHPKKNAFGYYCMIIWQAFVRRIAKEKKQQYIKYKSIINAIDDLEIQGMGGDCDLPLHLNKNNEQYKDMLTFIGEYEEAIAGKKADQKRKKVEKELAKILHVK